MTGAVLSSAVALATARPQLSLVAEPARVQLEGAGSQKLRVLNRGSAPVVLDVQRAGFALDLRGRPRIVSVARAAWLSVKPKRVAIPAGGTASLTVSGRVRRGAAPGDHASLLLLASRPLDTSAVAVRVRLGVVVVLRVPGRVVHRLSVLGVSARRASSHRLLTVRLANRGNVAEELRGADRVVVTLWRDGKLLARLPATPRELLPKSRGVLEVVYRGAVRGSVVCRVGRNPPGARFKFKLKL
jgi:hypothetical protein